MSDPTPRSTPTPPNAAPKCRRCESLQIAAMGRMEKSTETLYRCGQCGFVFTTT